MKLEQQTKTKALVQNSPRKPKKQYRHMQGTEDRLRLLLFEDARMIKNGILKAQIIEPQACINDSSRASP